MSSQGRNLKPIVGFLCVYPIIIAAVLVFIGMVYSGVATLYLSYTQETSRIDPNMIFVLSKEGSHDWNRSLKSNKTMPGFFYVFGHSVGDPNKSVEYMKDERTDKLSYYTPRAMAELIQNKMTERNIPLNTPVFLMSCNTGAGKEPFAQKVSEHLKGEVLATDQWLIINDFGITRTASNKWWGFLDLISFSYRRFIKGVEVSVGS